MCGFQQKSKGTLKVGGKKCRNKVNIRTRLKYTIRVGVIDKQEEEGVRMVHIVMDESEDISLNSYLA